METIDLIQRARAGDEEARKQVIEENIGLVWSIVKRYMGRGYEKEDLFQTGTMGLMKAIDRFDSTYEVRFSTYAVPLIQGEIKRFLRDDGMVKVSRTLKENGWKISQASQRLSQELGRDASLDELAAATSLSVEDIVLAMEANVEVESIYKTVYQSDGNEIYLVDKIVGESGSGMGREQADHLSLDAEKDAVVDHMLLEQLLNELPDMEYRLIKMRYFEEKTQVQVAKVLGISQVQVSRLEKKILKQMREAAKQ